MLLAAPSSQQITKKSKSKKQTRKEPAPPVRPDQASTLMRELSSRPTTEQNQKANKGRSRLCRSARPSLHTTARGRTPAPNYRDWKKSHCCSAISGGKL